MKKYSVEIPDSVIVWKERSEAGNGNHVRPTWTQMRIDQLDKLFMRDQ